MKKIDWSEDARADVRRIDRKMAMRIFTAIRRLAETGEGDVKELKGESGELRLRVGDYRVRFNRVLEFSPPRLTYFLVGPDAETIKTRLVRHRGESYHWDGLKVPAS